MDLHSGQAAWRRQSTQFRRTLHPRKRHTSPTAEAAGCDLRTRLSFDPPGTWSKNKADCMGPALGGETRVFKAGVAANFDPHGGLSLAHGRALCGRQQQVLERLSRVSLAHQRFADKKGMEPRGPQPVHIFSRLDAAFAHAHGRGRQPGGEIERDFEPYSKCFEIAVIDADRVAIKIQDPFKLLGRMHLAEDVQLQGVGLRLPGDGALDRSRLRQSAGWRRPDGHAPPAAGTRRR